MNICQNCQQPTSNPKFCSKSCSVSYNNKIKPKRSRQHTEKCVVCQKVIDRNSKKCCSKICRSALLDKLYNEYFLLHQTPKTSSNGHICPRRVKKSLNQIRGNKCEICGIETWQNKDLIKILDHIDGNSENWNINNLRLVCSNCDSQLPTYKSKNKGNGRYFRKQRYENGQSY